MLPAVQSFLAGFPNLVLHLAVTLGLLGGAAALYTRITPHDEIKLIRHGNVAAAISFSGAVLGLAIPLAFCLAASVGVWDILIWGVVTLVLQLLALRVIEVVMQGMSHRIEAGEVGPAVLLFAVKLSVAAINAAAVTG
ncbi:DUF350 domain-containing protein [Thalassobaculum fulvum]|jgi:putative membrane protein|uniref:DUF350 domain-containing protein n=1 Tax=Thalassobaculum fulvum TaxID=1633335 RepID=A0A919CTX9_9PROT|nr:DUF350 domain-containing protein [Thalassobaculum fulvum]GHD63332.1 DUF350 domain-containing protein [Thalassobaculum fulvum]